MTTSASVPVHTPGKTIPSVDERLRHAHFNALGFTQLAKELGPSADGKLELRLERILMDVIFKTSRRLRKDSIVPFGQALLGNRVMPQGLRGNFGFLYYLRNNAIEWGYSRVGASTHAAKWLKNRLAIDPTPVTQKDIPKILFQSLPGKHKHSEYLLINALGNFLQSPSFQSKVGGDITGHILLFTELSPCESCTLVIKQLLAAYPGITVTVAYALEYTYDPAVLKPILAARAGSALQQFNQQVPANMHWERKA